MFFNLKGKKVLLTGSTGTIGTSIAKIFNKSGAKLICTSTSSEKLKILKNIIGSEHFFYLINLNDNNDIESKLDEIVSKHNDIKIHRDSKKHQDIK